MDKNISIEEINLNKESALIDVFLLSLSVLKVFNKNYYNIITDKL